MRTLCHEPLKTIIHTLNEGAVCHEPLKTIMHTINEGAVCHEPLKTIIHTINEGAMCHEPLKKTIHLINENAVCHEPLTTTIHLINEGAVCHEPLTTTKHSINEGANLNLNRCFHNKDVTQYNVCNNVTEFCINATGSFGLECYNCKHVASMEDCNTTTECAAGESCFHQTEGETSTLGCVNNQNCALSSAIGSGLVGRRSTDIELASICVDDPSIDCARMNTLLNVCGDVHHAKLICPRFCGLCNIVDGNWASWSRWSRCDATCSNGKQSRHRTCTNPAPENGGRDCVESNMETKVCTNNPCPDGGWSDWQDWTACPVTCGGGLQNRQRYCNNPKPSLLGYYCVGMSETFELCNNIPCHDAIVFLATLATSSTVGADNRIEFDTVVQNIGSAYNATTSVFTAPYDGSYVFSAKILVRASTKLRDDGDFCLRKNNTCVASFDLYFGNGDEWESGSLTSAIYLEKEETVDIMTFFDVHIYGNSPGFTMFSGSFLSKK
ncbi:ECT-like protein [Mya arenaria]|uniref:ECT-like protein n=1 Tax=Mya arenaria TaxID=6604 RepID=A0ABY7EQG0_MYAAR|nr:ECT-like protein [Mya arenaria]